MKDKILKKLAFSHVRIVVFILLEIILIILSVIKVKTSYYNAKNYTGMVIYGDVGQGDSAVIRLPDGKVMVIDSGPDEEKAKRNITKALSRVVNSDNVIDYVVLTHTDVDHCGNMCYLFDNYVIKNFYRPNQFQPGIEDVNPYEERNDFTNAEYIRVIIKAQNEEGINTYVSKAGMTINGSGYKVNFIAPLKTVYDNSNDYSSVIMLNIYNKKFLFTGDISSAVEEEIINVYPPQKTDFLKVAHHGSRYSSSYDFINHFLPDYAIISCEKNNQYGFPSPSVINNLTSNGVEKQNILCTYNGNIYVFVSEEKCVLAGENDILRPYTLVYLIVILTTINFLLCFIKFYNKDEY